MLISISFNFVGFLLTYLLHTTHAAKLGARAGLGVTLIQYGLALRSGRDGYGGYRGDNTGMGGGSSDNDPLFGGWPAATASASPPTFATAPEAEDWMKSHSNYTNGQPEADSVGDSDVVDMYVGDVTNEWLAFLLMTIGEYPSICTHISHSFDSRAGWFILLTSVLGFWRVKRWERSILESQTPGPSQSQPPNTAAQNSSTEGSTDVDTAVMSHLQRRFGLRLPSSHVFRQGLGFGGSARDSPRDGRPRRGRDEEEVEARDSEDDRLLFPTISLHHPDRQRIVAEAYANERRLQQDLRAAGLI